MRRVFDCLTCVLILTCLGAGLLTSCGRQTTPPPSAAEVLTAMTDAMTASAQPLPDGLTYTRAADPASPSYLTDTLFSALYGEAARGLFLPDAAPETGGVPPVGDLSPIGDPSPIGDAAVYLSLSAYPCELAVFRCSDLRTAATVAGLCQSRLDTVAVGHRNSEWAEIAAGGRVAVEGCYVLLAVAEDPGAVLEAARRMLR